MAEGDFRIEGAGGSPISISEVHRDGNKTVFEDYAICEKGGAVLFPFDSGSPDDFGQQLNVFINDIQGSVFPFRDGAGSATIQLPLGEFEVITSIEVPSGFFIRGFGTRYESGQSPGTTLLWKGDPNDWSGAPQDDQTPWKGFCVVFRGGYISGLSHLRIDCTTITSPPNDAPTVTPGRSGVFVGSLNDHGPNARGITQQVRVEYVVVENADIGLQHGNTTRMDTNVRITSPDNGKWDLTITKDGTPDTYTYTPPASPPETIESIVTGLINVLNSGSPKPVDEKEVFTFSHGTNFDIITRDPDAEITVSLASQTSPPRWYTDDFSSNNFKEADFCEFRNCYVSGFGSRGMLLDSNNNDLSLIERCNFKNAFISIDVRNAGVYKMVDVTCDPRRHQDQLLPPSDWETGTTSADPGERKLTTSANFYQYGVHAGDILAVEDNDDTSPSEPPNSGDYWIREVSKNYVVLDRDWESGDHTVNFKVYSQGGIGINVATKFMGRSTIDGYNQERGYLSCR